MLAARAARSKAVAAEFMVRRWLAGVGMRCVGLVGEGVHHRPRGGTGERQGGESVLIRGAAGAVVVVQRQVGHVWVGSKRTESI